MALPSISARTPEPMTASAELANPVRADADRIAVTHCGGTRQSASVYAKNCPMAYRDPASRAPAAPSGLGCSTMIVGVDRPEGGHSAGTRAPFRTTINSQGSGARSAAFSTESRQVAVRADHSATGTMIETRGVAVVDVSDNLVSVRTSFRSQQGHYSVSHGPPASLLAGVAPLLAAGFPLRVVEVRWMGSAIRWPVHSRVFPPTFDALFLVRTLLDLRLRAGDVWDVGCGAGIIGLMLRAVGAARTIRLTDSDPVATEVASANAASALDSTVICEAFPPSRPESACKVELLVANPPYFAARTPGLNAWAGQATDLSGFTDSLTSLWSLYAGGLVYLAPADSPAVQGERILGRMDVNRPPGWTIDMSRPYAITVRALGSVAIVPADQVDGLG